MLTPEDYLLSLVKTGLVMDDILLLLLLSSSVQCCHRQHCQNHYSYRPSHRCHFHFNLDYVVPFDPTNLILIFGQNWASNS